MAREPVTIVEVDYEGCDLTFSVGACTAALSATTPRKCFNTYATCSARAAFSLASRTIRFAEPRPGLPADTLYFPALRSVSVFSSSVNLAGVDDSLSALGRRATVAIELQDFPYHDRALDPYAAQRVSGAAQFDGVGYDPATRGTFFGKLKARWPFYAGRPLRVVQGFLEGGALVDAVAQNFVITDLSAPDSAGRVKLAGKDVLALAEDDRAQAPAPSKGALLADITDAATALTLTPAGIGAEYAAEGRAVIGSELVSWTRAGDVVTLTGRALAGSKLAAHKAGDAFQVALHFDGVRLDDALEILLRDYAKVPPAYIPKAKWAAEISRWMPTTLLTTHICKPTGVAKLVGELAIFGAAIWWDAKAQEIGLKSAVRPPDGDTVWTLTAAANIKELSAEERDEKRLTEVLFFSVQIDPTKGAETSENYSRLMVTADLEAKGPRQYADTRARKIFCRWLDSGGDGVAAVASSRLLKRLNTPPVLARVLLDWQDAAIGLTDVVEITAPGFQDETGAALTRQMQVVSRSDPVPGHELEILAQAYSFAGRYGFATEDARPAYLASNTAQRTRGMYAAGAITLKMSNGDEPYRAI